MRARTVCDLYRRRWDIEVFFKQIKQVLHIIWQIYSALLMYLLLRYQAFLSKWTCCFTQLFTRVRAALWEYIDISRLMECYGTATGPPHVLEALEQLQLKGLE